MEIAVSKAILIQQYYVFIKNIIKVNQSQVRALEFQPSCSSLQQTG